MIKNVKWIFVVFIISSLISFSFVGKNTPTEGLTIGDKAPTFTICGEKQLIDLKDLRGKYVLLSFRVLGEGADGGGRAGTDGNAGADAGDAHGQGGGDHADAHIVVGSGGCGLAVGGEGHAGKGARQCEYGNQYQKGAGKLFNIHLFHNRYSILPQIGVVLI